MVKMSLSVVSPSVEHSFLLQHLKSLCTLISAMWQKLSGIMCVNSTCCTVYPYCVIGKKLSVDWWLGPRTQRLPEPLCSPCMMVTLATCCCMLLMLLC